MGGGGGGTGAIRPRMAMAPADRRARGAPQAVRQRPPSLTVSQTAHFQSVFVGVRRSSIFPISLPSSARLRLGVGPSGRAAVYGLPECG